MKGREAFRVFFRPLFFFRLLFNARQISDEKELKEHILLNSVFANIDHFLLFHDFLRVYVNM